MTSEVALSGAPVMLAPRKIPRTRKRLAFDYLLRHVLRPRAMQFPDARQRDGDYTVADAALSALAMFSLKDPSLLAFQNRRHDQNMKNLYRIVKVPSDTQMRQMLVDDIPQELRATGTDGNCQLRTQDAQHAQRKTRRTDASECEDRTKPTAQKELPKPLQIADIGDCVRLDAKKCPSSGGGIRTTHENPRENRNRHSEAHKMRSTWVIRKRWTG
jgi:hypothetical protein